MQPNDNEPSTDGNTNVPQPEITPSDGAAVANTIEPTETVDGASTDSSVPAQTVTQPSVQPAEQPSNNSGKRKKLGLILGIVGLVVLLGGGSAAAYFKVVVPNQPQRITQDAVANTINQEKVTSGHFEGEVGISGGETADVISGITFEGAANDKNALDLKVSINTAVTKVGLDLRSTDSSTYYLRLTGLNGLDKILGSLSEGDSEEAAMLSELAPLIAQVNDQWFSIDKSLLNQFGGENLSAAQEKISSEDAKKIGDIYKKHQFIKIDKKLADQNIHGVASYHIQASVDKDKLVSFLGEVKSANIKALKLDQETIDGIGKANLSKYPFDLWVSKSNRVVTQLATSIEDNGTTYKVRIAMFDVNKEVKVETPSGAKSVLELLSGLAPVAGGLLGGSESDTEVTPLDSFSL
jgi:hypothetical protein